MKPIELLPKIAEDKYYGYSSERKLLRSYQDEDCIIAYTENCLGTIFLIRGKQIFMGFILTKRDFRGYTLYRIDLKETYQLLNSHCDKGNMKIINPDLWKRFEAKMVLTELESEGN